MLVQADLSKGIQVIISNFMGNGGSGSDYFDPGVGSAPLLPPIRPKKAQLKKVEALLRCTSPSVSLP
jgi:hypothetical protein